MQEYDKSHVLSTSSTPTSVPTPVTHSHSTTPAPESKGAHGKLSTDEVITALGIPKHLTGKSTKDVGLKVYYAKYQACLKAYDTMQNMYREGSWPAPKMVNKTTIVELFVSKTMWHSHVQRFFKNIADYPEMQMWLEGGEDDDLGVWGVTKTSFTFNDLATYMEDINKLRAKKGKGKKKEKEGNKEGDKEGDKAKKGKKKGNL